MRKYQPIWEQLKENHTASVAVPENLQRRVIAGVIKEKTLDSGWKVICAEQRVMYKLSYKREGSLVTFAIGLERSTRYL